MFFRRMSLHGFKSFANRTEIPLQPGITIVVGPNGCGKSNVFDSIQWALGEQRAKTLRGARMGDVIFAGSSTEKAATLCEVSLQVCNEAGHLPVDATELEITRRLYRSGESEYLINDQPCRLKDIQQLIMGTGLGQNSYAIMQQGRMDAIINTRPSERRYLIEEAAGISKYKAQKEEALRRLERTDEDLTRLTDLVNEIKRNAGKLRKQAERAREYKEIAARLRTYEMVLMARRFDDIVREREEAESEYVDLEERLGSLDARINQLQSMGDASRDEMAELVALLEAAQESQRELQKERLETEGRERVLTERLTQIAQRRERLTIELETLSGQSSGHQTEIAAQEEEMRKLRIAIREEELTLDRRTAVLQGLKEGATDQEQELANLRESLGTMQADRGQLEGEIRYARQMLESLESRVTNGDDRLKELAAGAAEATDKLEEARQAAYAVRDQYEQVTNKLAEKRDMLGKADARQKDLKGRHTETMNALRDARSRLGALQQLQENYEGFMKGVREVMRQADDGKLGGVVGVVANLVRPKERCERAIEVALGGSVQNIVVETAQDGKECINFLKRRDFGRATFLPIETIQGRSNNREFAPVMRMQGVVGWATDLVEFDPHIRPVVENLLGNTIVVEHLDVALLLERKGLRTKYVTLDGDLLNPTGAMTGGSYKASGLLSREGEISQLTEVSESLARQLVDLDADIDRLESSVAGYRQAIQQLSDESTRLQIALANSVKDAQTLEERARELQQRHETFREEYEGAADERQAFEDQIRINTEALRDLDTQIRNLQRRAEELSRQQGSRSQMINDTAAAIQELRVGIAQKRERLSGCERAIERLREESTRQAGTLESRETELAKLDAEEKIAHEEIQQLQNRLAELVARHEALSAEVKAQSQDRQEKVDALQRLIEEQRTAERERNILQNDLHDADMRRTQKDMQLESLQSQAREKFETDLSDVFASLEAELEALATSRNAVPIEGSAIVPVVSEANGQNAPSGGARVIDVHFDADDHSHNADSPAQPTAATKAEASDMEHDERMRARWLEHPLAQLPLESLQDEASNMRRRLEALGPVNMMAIEEYDRIEERLDFMTGQQKDLVSARDTILRTIQKIDETTATMFRECFDTVREYFINNFRTLFGGGKADLVLTDPENLLETGIDIVAQPPGKKPQTITLLSGGERCLTAIGLMFALFQWKPSPFCVLDEIDAPLDDANVERFKAMIREFAHSTQFLIITHNKLTMELADTIFGITMQEPGISSVVSVRFEDVDASGLLDAPSSLMPTAAPASA